MAQLFLTDIARMTRAEAEDAIRANVQTCYLGDRSVLTRILGRQKLYLSTDDVGFAGHVMMDGYWEIWLTQFFARAIKPGMTVVDVGANFGYYTMLFGEAVGPQGRVVAVEPVPETFKFLQMSTELNGHSAKTQLVNAALGKTVGGSAHIFIPNNEPKNAMVSAGAGDGTFEVPSTTLDDLVKDFPRVDIVKIDVEGAERDVIAGMKDTFKKHAPDILIEFNAGRYEDPMGFLIELQSVCSSMSWLDFEAKLQPVVTKDLLTTKVGEDWLLYLRGYRS